VKKILDMEMPEIRVYPHHSNLLGILCKNSYELPLLYNYYVPLMYNVTVQRLDFAIGYEIVPFLANCTTMLSNRMSRTMVDDNWDTFHDFVISAINDESYVHCLVDMYAIQAYKDEYKKEHITHNIMIYGYDEEEKEVYIADCFVNGVYSLATATFDEIDESFEREIYNDWIDGVWLFKREDAPYIPVGYKTDKIRNDINSYIKGELAESINLYEKYERSSKLADNIIDVACGIRVYEKIIQYLIQMVQQRTEIDIRINYMLYEHKNYLCILCNELYSIGQFKDIFGIYNEILKIRTKLQGINNLILKYNMTRAERNVQKIIEILTEVERSERSMMHLFEMSIQDLGNREDYRVCRNIPCTDIKIVYDGEWNFVQHNNVDTAIMKAQDSKCSLLFWGDGIKVFTERFNLNEMMVYLDGKKVELANINEVDGAIEISDMMHGYHMLTLCGGNLKLLGFFIKKNKLLEDNTFVKFAGMDVETKGDWEGKYGKEGYMIIGLPNKLPEYMTASSIQIYNTGHVILKRRDNDSRSLSYPGKDGRRIQAIKVSPREIEIDIIITGGMTRKISLYMADFENFGRSTKIEMYNADTREIILVDEIEKYEEGRYVTYEMCGHINVRLINISNPDVVLSGIFID